MAVARASFEIGLEETLFGVVEMAGASWCAVFPRFLFVAD